MQIVAVLLLLQFGFFLFLFLLWFSSVQFISVAQLCPTLWDPTDWSIPGLPVHHQLLELTQIHVHWVGDAIQPFHPLSSPSPQAFNLSQYQGLFKWVLFRVFSALHIRWPEYWSFSFSISPSNEYSGLISIRMDWLDRLAVQGALKSLLQHHKEKWPRWPNLQKCLGSNEDSRQSKVY